jgi:hypothetical protein
MIEKLLASEVGDKREEGTEENAVGDQWRCGEITTGQIATS